MEETAKKTQEDRRAEKFSLCERTSNKNDRTETLAKLYGKTH